MLAQRNRAECFRRADAEFPDRPRIGRVPTHLVGQVVLAVSGFSRKDRPEAWEIGGGDADGGNAQRRIFPTKGCAEGRDGCK